ncbi:MAG: protoporphyrinogen oxidase [Bacteroidetes bacterium]|nr:protoporphyrinogen oxidase [Bacteroidota bacterium]
MKDKVVIIGAGISGLLTGFFLKEKGFNVTILEKDAKAGGTMKSERINGFLVEKGPNSTLETTPLFKDVFSKLGIADKMIYAGSASSKRYILRGDKLREVPMSPLSFIITDLLSWCGKGRMLLEPFFGKAKTEETVARFVERRLGSEFLNYAINPFVAGVYAGDPASLSVRAAFPKLFALEAEYGSIFIGTLKGARKRKKRKIISKVSSKMFSFTGGMGTLPDTISKYLDGSILFNAGAESILSNDGKYTVIFSRNGKKEKIDSDILILSAPAFRTAKIISSVSSEISNVLMQIYYPPLSEIVFGFRNENIHFPMDGFGFLVPEIENKNILGAIWNTSIYPDRAPEGFSSFTLFMGGARNPGIFIMSDDEQLSVAFNDIKDIMKIKGNPEFSYITRWEKSIPQYNIGHLKIIEHLREFEKQYHSLYFCANYIGGISVADCLISADELANRISEEHKV